MLEVIAKLVTLPEHNDDFVYHPCKAQYVSPPIFLLYKGTASVSYIVKLTMT